MEGFSGKSYVLVYLARIRVEYGTVKIKANTWDKLMAQQIFVDSDDLYGTCWFSCYMTKHALDFKNRESLLKLISAIHDAKAPAIGEWDEILCTSL